MRCVLDVGLDILAGRAVKLMTLSYSFFSLLSLSVPKELFLKAWVHVCDHNVMAKGALTFTFSEQLLYNPHGERMRQLKCVYVKPPEHQKRQPGEAAS